MLNLGQVVYDSTNKRILIFGGIEMLQDQKTGKCHANRSFLTTDLEELFYGEDETTPFKYTNFDEIDGKIPSGEFIITAELGGCFFGCIDFEQVLKKDELVESIKKTFKAAKTWPIPVREKTSGQ